MDIERRDEVDYDQIMTSYQAILHKEREHFEITKNKKTNDVEIWNRARREEEKKAMKAYCEEHGKKEMEKIQAAVEARHAKELSTKKQLESASRAFSSFKVSLLAKRTQIHINQQKAFSNKIGDEVKERIEAEAARALQLITVKRMNEEAA